MINLIKGDSLESLKGFKAESFDSVVCDPPYGLSQIKIDEFKKTLRQWVVGNTNYTPKKKGFMGHEWDGFVPPPALWEEVYKVLKPGGHALVFAGTRTQDLMGLSLRLANFEIRDCIHWVYGSGFPKSQNIGKMVDKKLGNEREVIGRNPNSREACDKSNTLYKSGTVGKTAMITRGHTEWEGWGTTLKPAYEPILLVRKPLIGTVVQNVLEHRTGGLNIDACRVEGDRFPPNIIFADTGEADCPVNEIELQANAKRFFYCPKAGKKERGEGNTHPTVKPIELMRYLTRLVTPTGGQVLDPFMGSGSTGIACKREGFGFTGIELNEEYFFIAEARIGGDEEN